MAQNESDYEFYVGPATHLEGASLAIDGTARIDGKIVGKVAVKPHLVGLAAASSVISQAKLLRWKARSKIACSFPAS